MKNLFVGFKFLKTKSGKHESLDKKIFVDSTSTDKNETLFFPIDDYKSKEKLEIDLLSFLKKNNVKIIFFNLINNEISEETLIKLKSRYITINWFGDDQWRFNSFSSFKAKLFSYCITTDNKAVKKYKKIGVENIILSQWGLVEVVPQKENKIYKYDITFIGSYSIVREWVVYKLRENGLNIRAFGSGWDGNHFVDYNELIKIVDSTKINLNLSNSAPSGYKMILFFIVKALKEIYLPKKLKKNIYRILRSFKLKFLYNKNVEQIKARNFEINGFNGFQITNYVQGLESFFTNGIDIVYFKDIDDLIRKCKYYLKENKQRERIRYVGHKRSYLNTYKERFKKIFSQIDDFN